MNRRKMLKTSAMGATATWALPGFLGDLFAPAALAESELVPQPDGPLVVVLQLSGGNDSLNTIVPHNHHESSIYYDARPGLAIPPELVMPIDGRSDVGFHPKLNHFKSLWDEESLAIVNGVGYPNPNLSHFKSTDYYHTAKPNLPSRDGWLGRFFEHQCASGCESTAGVEIAGTTSLAFRSATPQGQLTLVSQEDFGWKGSGVFRSEPGVENVISKILNASDNPHQNEYQQRALRYLNQSAEQALRASGGVQAAMDKVNAANGSFPKTTFPETRLGKTMRGVASMIYGGFNTPVYYVNQSGYDTHGGQYDVDSSGVPLPLQGRHADLLGELDDAVGAFVAELKAQGHWERTLIFTFSEFGRKVTENGSTGTDHGAAQSLFVFGGGVRRGMYGEMPSLADAARIKNNSLAYNVDFRRVYRTVLEKWLGVPPSAIQTILPSPSSNFSPLDFV